MAGKRKSKVTLVVSTLLAGVFLMSSCSVDMNGIGDAFSDLGENLNQAVRGRQESQAPASTAETTVVIEAPSDETIPEMTEISETEAAPEPTATPTPAPTATPIPSPTPVPQRVDFSDLTSDPLTDNISIDYEDFSESAHAEDDDDILLAEFTGTRVLLESEDDIAETTAVNLMLDSFYMEAEGLYNRAVYEQYAAYELDPETVPATIDVEVDYECLFNGRLLCVVMNYSVTQEEEVLRSDTEYYRFDLYTGQIINSGMLLNDVDAFYDALAETIADSTASRTDRAEDYDIEFFTVETDDDGETEVVAVVSGDGGFEYYTVEVPYLYDSLTRYGRIVLNVTYVEADEEADEDTEEDSDEDEDSSDETGEAEESEETEETEETRPSSRDDEDEEEEEER